MEEFRTALDAPMRAFNEEEQAEIIARAASLQRQHGQSSTLSDLERAALEAGIEPRFVREAARLQDARTEKAAMVATLPSRDHYWRSAMLAIIFLPAEILAMTVSHELGHVVWGAFVIAVIFGLALPRQTYSRWVALLWPFFVVTTILVFNPSVRDTGLLVLAIVQSAIAIGVNRLAAHLAEIPGRNR